MHLKICRIESSYNLDPSVSFRHKSKVNFFKNCCGEKGGTVNEFFLISRQCCFKRPLILPMEYELEFLKFENVDAFIWYW